ncbi:MAG: Uma2 family endonuclease [Alphaproteobacteria bacterium]|nr:Uma2 family endonuclease [Alphaproteobacteria bacterium]
MSEAAGTFPKPWTVEDFLAWESQQEDRYEFVDGILRAMTGGTVDHATIIGNVFGALRERLRGGPCRAYTPDLKVKAGENVMYPDVVVVCAPSDPKATEVTDPVVVVEVLSKSTSDYDRGRKWLAYQSISTLAHFLLVSQDECRIDAFRRMENGWFSETFSDVEGQIVLSAINARLNVRDIYEGSSVAARLAG